MVALFQRDIATAKAKLSQATPHPKTTPTANIRLFGSHRSGVDAFMTGFVFTCYVLQSQPRENRGERRVSVCGLEELRNCLASRARSKHRMPLRIAKSQFAKHSITHLSAKQRLDTLAREN